MHYEGAIRAKMPVQFKGLMRAGFYERNYF